MEKVEQINEKLMDFLKCKRDFEEKMKNAKKKNLSQQLRLLQELKQCQLNNANCSTSTLLQNGNLLNDKSMKFKEEMKEKLKEIMKKIMKKIMAEIKLFRPIIDMDVTARLIVSLKCDRDIPEIWKEYQCKLQIEILAMSNQGKENKEEKEQKNEDQVIAPGGDPVKTEWKLVGEINLNGNKSEIVKKVIKVEHKWEFMKLYKLRVRACFADIIFDPFPEITFNTYQRPLDFDSVIMGLKEQQVLNSYLPKGLYSKAKLLLRASRDGFEPKTFHEKCKKNQLSPLF